MIINITEILTSLIPQVFVQVLVIVVILFITWSLLKRSTRD